MEGRWREGGVYHILWLFRKKSGRACAILLLNVLFYELHVGLLVKLCVSVLSTWRVRSGALGIYAGFLAVRAAPQWIFRDLLYVSRMEGIWVYCAAPILYRGQIAVVSFGILYSPIGGIESYK